VEVVVAFEEAGAGGGDHGLEESGGANIGGEADARGAEMGKETFEQTELENVSLGLKYFLNESSYMPGEG